MVLGPIVVMGVFTWNLMFQRKLDQLGDKVRRDFVPSMLTGKFAPFILFFELCVHVWKEAKKSNKTKISFVKPGSFGFQLLLSISG